MNDRLPFVWLLQILPFSGGWCQQPQIIGVEIAKVSMAKDQEGAPTVTISLVNNSEQPVLFTNVGLDLMRFTPNYHFDGSGSRRLQPIAYWHIAMATATKKHRYKIPHGVVLAAHDVASVQIRLTCRGKGKKEYLPQQCGVFTFRLSLIDHKGRRITTQVLKVGDETH